MQGGLDILWNIVWQFRGAVFLLLAVIIVSRVLKKFFRTLKRGGAFRGR